jgi:MoaA/NifB/PqqE/SkfB family radical SAM enzyme
VISSQQRKFLAEIPRLPLEGSLDLTYRCNNNCRHCWLRIPADAREIGEELTFQEIKDIVTAARSLGCRSWNISGGEPMLRPDFPEIFELLTAKAVSYSLNTNGTLITPALARLLRRKGGKLVALYGATSQVHDHITRTPGSFDATMQGMAYLREAGAGFTVQLIPLRDNYHQYEEMVKLARQLSPHYRVGAAWLWLSACGSPQRDVEISHQRLAPHDVIRLDPPDMSSEEQKGDEAATCQHAFQDDRLLARCVAHCRDFHIDPYGRMTSCSFIKDPALRYDLRSGSFEEAWNSFIPSLADKVRGGPEYLVNCGTCELRSDCRWCDVYGYLEHRHHGAKVEYLCEVAREQKVFKDNWQRHHRRYYQIAGFTVQVDTDLPITDQTFNSKFNYFQIDTPGPDLVALRHHFSLPAIMRQDLGKEVYRRAPWAIYQKNRSWIYLGGAAPEGPEPHVYQVAVFNQDYSRARIYHRDKQIFVQGNLTSLTLFPTDQILLAQVLAHRQGFFFHSSAAVLEGQGLLFVGHSEAGKSTTVKMLKGKAEILCDDRNIVRRWPEGFKVHGSWSHGEVPLVSPASAPLRAILLLQQAEKNCLTLLEDRRTILSRLLACIIKPLVTADWWEKTLTLLAQVTREVPCYLMEFDRSGEIVSALEELVRQPAQVGGNFS